MPDDRRVYNDKEFALILRKAAELESRAQLAAPSSAGLTLREIKAVAAQAGFDPALVERVAHELALTTDTSPLERLVGGPLRHQHKAAFPIRLDERKAAELLSAVRISAGETGGGHAGHSGAAGMTWHDGGEFQVLSVSARAEEEGTSVSVVLDRRGALATVAGVSGLATFFALLFAGSALYPESAALGYGGAIVGVGGALTAARAYWAASTRKARERIETVMDSIGQTLAKLDKPPSE